jgi:3-oxoadipate enol-lactonase
MSIEQTFKTSDGIRLHYVIDDFTDPWKSADTLVLLHSAMSSARRYYPLVPALSRHYRVVRLDLRGHGESEVPAADSVLDMPRLVRDVHELFDALGVSKVHLLGNSAGGYVAQNVAIRHPERVKSLLLFGSTTGLKGTSATTWIPRVQKEGLRPFLEDTIAYRFDIDKTDPGVVKFFLDEVEKNNIGFIARFVPLMTTVDTSNDLPKIKCPALVVIPGKEVSTGERNYDAMKKIADCTIIDFPGIAHNMMDSIPDECAEVALKFLQERFGKVAKKS